MSHDPYRALYLHLPFCVLSLIHICFVDQSVTSEDESVMQPRLQIWR